MSQITKQQRVQNALGVIEDLVFEVGTLRDVVYNIENGDSQDFAGDYESQVAVLDTLINERLGAMYDGVEFIRELTQSKPRTKKSKKAKLAVAKAA